MAIHTKLSDLFKIRYPIIQAATGPFTSAELVAAVSNAGGLGSLGTGLRSLEYVKEHLTRIRDLTNKPFAVNCTLAQLNEDLFATILEAKPPLSPWVTPVNWSNALILSAA
jgi:enoyl-[acyl-carrier protein] reductase II